MVFHQQRNTRKEKNKNEFVLDCISGRHWHPASCQSAPNHVWSQPQNIKYLVRLHNQATNIDSFLTAVQFTLSILPNRYSRVSKKTKKNHIHVDRNWPAHLITRKSDSNCQFLLALSSDMSIFDWDWETERGYSVCGISVWLRGRTALPSLSHIHWVLQYTVHIEMSKYGHSKLHLCSPMSQWANDNTRGSRVQRTKK